MCVHVIIIMDVCSVIIVLCKSPFVPNNILNRDKLALFSINLTKDGDHV